MNATQHLQSYLAEARVRRFDWHAFNCGHFAAGWIERAEHRKIKLPSLQDQLRLRDEMGGVAPVVSMMIARPPLDFKRMAQEGDIVLLPSRRPERCYVGICCGRYAAFLPMSGEELAFVSWTDTATHAWHVDKELLT